MTDHSDSIIELAKQRARDGLPHMTDADLLEYHYSVRDGCLVWMRQCVEYGRDKGLKSAEQLYEFSCRQISRLKRSK